MKQKVDHVLEKTSTLRAELRATKAEVSKQESQSRIEIETEKGLLLREDRVPLGPEASKSKMQDVTVASSSDILLRHPLTSTSLRQWLQLVELEHTLRLQKLEEIILRFCVDVLLPQFKASGAR